MVRDSVKSDDFIFLSSEDVVKIISCDYLLYDLAVRFEKKSKQTAISNFYI